MGKKRLMLDQGSNVLKKVCKQRSDPRAIR
jgi:hypothetical protein